MTYAVSPRLTKIAIVCSALALGSVAGCTCKKTEEPREAAVTTTPVVDASPDGARAYELPRLSLPMGAALLPSGAVIVAGLSVPERMIKVARIAPDGRVDAVADIFQNAEWAHDSEVGVHPVGDDVIVTFRGKVEGGQKRSLVRLDPKLSAKEPRTYTATSCATKDGVYWLDHRRVHAELGAGHREHTVPAAEGDLGLFCDESHALVTVDAEGVLSVVPVLPDAMGPLAILVGEKDFEDEEREHSLFLRPEGPSVLRIGNEGALSVKLPGQAARKIVGKLEEDDDLVLVDADVSTVYVASTQDHDGCEAGEDASTLPTQRTSRFSTAVHLLRVDLGEGKATRENLGRAACGHQASTFFFGKAKDRRVLAWTERAPASNKTMAPIAALAYRVIGPTAGGTVAKRIPLRADGLVDAGCNATTCAAVWLERPEGEDDRKPELPRVLRFPE